VNPSFIKVQDIQETEELLNLILPSLSYVLQKHPGDDEENFRAIVSLVVTNDKPICEVA
jgi:hypothetical protein